MTVSGNVYVFVHVDVCIYGNGFMLVFVIIYVREYMGYIYVCVYIHIYMLVYE